MEVDFVWTGPRRSVGVEVKATRRWRPGAGAALRDLQERGVIQAAVAVYGGEHPQQDRPVTVLPVSNFLAPLPDLFA